MIENILLTPGMLAKLQGIKGDIYRKVGTFEAEAYLSDEPVPKSEWDSLEFKPFSKGKYWTHKRFGCAVFRLRGKIPEAAKGQKVVAVMKFGGEAEIYRDGKALCAVTPILSTIEVGQPLPGKQIVTLADPSEGEEDVVLFADCGHNGYVGVFFYDPRFIKADIAIVDTERKDFYYDCLHAILTLSTRNKNDYLTKEGIDDIKTKFNEAYALYKKGKVSEARKVMEPLFEKNTRGVKYTAVGHGHLDLAWRWPLREGMRKAVRTFSNVAAFMKDYDFVFGASQAQMFEWTEELQPELFERIKELVASGAIEIQGGMWTECDCNLSGGESLIRQFTYGEKYFIEKFGKSSDVVWLPDVFGFPSTLPQIMAGVGKKYFMTIKLNWNEYNKFPLQSFKWVGADGSEIISHMAPEGTYACSASPIAFVNGDSRNVQKETGSALLIYGVSDGGGGPGEGHLEMLKRAGGKYTPRAVAGSAESVFKKLEKIELPSYSGELYLEKHQGTLTSQAKNKYYNRLAERRMHNLEWLESVTGEKFVGRDGIWKRLLTNQFHDILPGSGIERVHKESVEDLDDVCRVAEKETDRLIKSLSKGKGLTALNPSPFDAEEKVVFGGKVYNAKVKAYSSAKLTECKVSPVLAVTENSIENDKIKVVFNLKTGAIVAVTDKTSGKTLSNGEFHNLFLYSDPQTFYDAWDISKGYTRAAKKKPVLENIVFTVEKDRAKAEIHATIGKSKIEQEIFVKDTETIYFDTQVNWNENHKMLRADIKPSAWSDKANFDVQFGSTERSTRDETDKEKAQYEVCAHYYAAVGEEDSGYAAVMTTGKYGYRVKNGEISLNLLRAPTNPDPNCDRGEQNFSYAVTFAPTLKEVVARAYNYNNPLIISEEDVEIEPEYNVVGDGIIVETLKRAETGDATVIRVYERFGKPSVGRIIMPEGKEAKETDMLERPLSQTPITELTFKPHEIKTVIIY